MASPAHDRVRIDDGQALRKARAIRRIGKIDRRDDQLVRDNRLLERLEVGVEFVAPEDRVDADDQPLVRRVAGGRSRTCRRR